MKCKLKGDSSQTKTRVIVYIITVHKMFNNKTFQPEKEEKMQS